MRILRLKENGLMTASLSLQDAALGSLKALSPAVIDISRRFSPDRAEVERFIRARYKDSYDADIEVSYPVLMSLRNDKGEILAAVGFRYANEGPLFLEQYTCRPIEKIVSEIGGREIDRKNIVEIGNLASAGSGASIFLFAALASYLDSQGVEYTAMTGTQILHRRFERLGLPLHVICDAGAGSLKRDNEKWGRYYETKPRVLAGYLPDGVKRFRETLGVDYHSMRPRLFLRLHYKGWES